MELGPEEVKEAGPILAGSATLIATFMAWLRSRAKSAAVMDARFDKKAEKDEVARHHGAILDLYAKHDRVRDRFDSLEKISADRHLETIQAISSLKK